MINVVTAALAVFFMGLVWRAYWPLVVSKDEGWGDLVTKGFMILAGVILLRLSYWDGAQFVLGDNWIPVRDALGGQQFSAVFNVPVIWAAYYFLKARWLLIPAEDRRGYHWWNSWAYPPGKCLVDWRVKRR